MILEKTRKTHREKENFFILKNEKMKKVYLQCTSSVFIYKNRATDFPSNTEPITL